MKTQADLPQSYDLRAPLQDVILRPPRFRPSAPCPGLGLALPFAQYHQLFFCRPLRIRIIMQLEDFPKVSGGFVFL